MVRLKNISWRNFIRKYFYIIKYYFKKWVCWIFNNHVRMKSVGPQNGWTPLRLYNVGKKLMCIFRDWKYALTINIILTWICLLDLNKHYLFKKHKMKMTVWNKMSLSGGRHWSLTCISEIRSMSSFLLCSRKPIIDLWYLWFRTFTPVSLCLFVQPLEQ